MILAIAAAHVAATLAMTGVIWLVQLVQYPLLAAVGRDHFHAYHQAHMRRITWIVGPLMLIEAGSAAALTMLTTGGAQALAVVGLALCAGVWASTWLLQVPQHGALERRGFDADVHARLVRSNWLRTAGWTARAGVALALWAALAGVPAAVG